MVIYLVDESIILGSNNVVYICVIQNLFQLLDLQSFFYLESIFESFIIFDIEIFEKSKNNTRCEIKVKNQKLVQQRPEQLWAFDSFQKWLGDPKILSKVEARHWGYFWKLWVRSAGRASIFEHLIFRLVQKRVKSADNHENTIFSKNCTATSRVVVGFRLGSEVSTESKDTLEPVSVAWRCYTNF